jgi:septal ring factor EnvC (AmiA/AmiB activator)
MSWPGLHTAVDDLQFLVDMSAQTTAKLEQEHSSMREVVHDAHAESATLKETLAMQNQTKEDLQRKLNELGQEHRGIAAQYALASKEVQQQKQVRCPSFLHLCEQVLCELVL